MTGAAPSLIVVAVLVAASGCSQLPPNPDPPAQPSPRRPSLPAPPLEVDAITFVNDTIETGCCECCAHALIFRAGRFFRVTTAD